MVCYGQPLVQLRYLHFGLLTQLCELVLERYFRRLEFTPLAWP